AQLRIEVPVAVARGARQLREREGIGLGPRPLRADETLHPPRRRVARHDTVERAVDRHACTQPGERPELGLGRAPAFRLARERAGELGACRGWQTLAGADRLPHLAQLLRPGAWPAGLATPEERRVHELQEALLLARGEPARDALPEVPPLGAALDGARMAQLARQHAPEAVHPHLVAGVAEAGTQQEAGLVQPAGFVLG